MRPCNYNNNNDPSLRIMTLYSQCTVCQGEVGCGAGVRGRQYLRAGLAGVSPHQQEAGRRSPAGVPAPEPLELVTLLLIQVNSSIASRAGNVVFTITDEKKKAYFSVIVKTLWTSITEVIITMCVLGQDLHTSGDLAPMFSRRTP